MDLLLYVFLTNCQEFLLHFLFFKIASVRFTDWFIHRYGPDPLLLTSDTTFPLATELYSAEDVGSYEILIRTYQTAWYIIPEHLIYCNEWRVTNPVHKPGNMA